MIKKTIFSLLLALPISLSSQAQMTNSGFPWSMNYQGSIAINEYNYPATDNTENLNKPQPSAYMVATTFPVDISFPESGILVRTPQGGYVWKVKITVDEAKAIGTYFDRFSVPRGVSLYATNANGRHIVGPYTIEDMTENNNLVVDAVQGSEMYLELNIAEDVDLNAIDFHIYKLASYFRGVEDLDYYTDDSRYGKIDWWDDAAYETSSQCMINAVCPLTEGFDLSRRATVKLVISADGGVGYCSGTMVNRIGNTEADCKRYLLTATHCEGSNSTSGPVFSEWITKFNYQTPTCENPDNAPVANNITGVKFIARDPYNPSALDADFLLVQVQLSGPAILNDSAVLLGWDRNPSHTRVYASPNRFMFFHHPAGDVKKLSTAQTIFVADMSTWAAQFNNGYGAPGSSGSGMFDNNNRIMGIASTAIYGDVLDDDCLYSARGIFEAENTSRSVFYARLDYCWNNPSLASPTDAQKLSPWLDPTGSDVLNIDALGWKCQALGSVNDVKTTFEGDFNIYPNPSNNGQFEMNIRMDRPANANLEVYDITGKRVFAKDLGLLHSKIVNLDLSNLANGTYMVKIYNPSGQVTRKVVIAK